MAKKHGRKNGGLNLSAEIRAAWDADRSAKPAVIVEALKGKGITANSGLVSNIISQYRKKLGIKGRRRRRQDRTEVGNGQAGSAATSPSIGSVIEEMKLVNKAKELVGEEGLRQIVKAI